MKFILLVFLAGCATSSVSQVPSSTSSQTQVAETPTTNSEKFPVHDTCYLKEFNSKKFPWRLDDCKNFEEVYQDYQYFEAKLNKASRELLITKFIRGAATEESRFKILGNNSSGWKLDK